MPWSSSLALLWSDAVPLKYYVLYVEDGSFSFLTPLMRLMLQVQLSIWQAGRTSHAKSVRLRCTGAVTRTRTAVSLSNAYRWNLINVVFLLPHELDVD